MTEEEIKQKVFELLKNIAPETEPANLKPDDSIRKVLRIDSFDYLNFIVGLDESFNIETPEEDYGKIGTLKELIPYVLNHTASQAM